MVEYLVAATALALALFARLPGRQSAAEYLIDSLARWHRNYALLLALS